MEVKRVNLENCGKESDFVVVIDVLRAFTTAAVAFAQGAREIIMVGTQEELFRLSNQFTNALTIGENNGIPIEGVDYGNSPSALKDLDLTGRRLIQRTTTGTQGVLRSSNAGELLATSLCCASATVKYIKKADPQSLTLVESGVIEGEWGDEDRACADLIEALLKNEPFDSTKIIERVYASKSAGYYQNADNGFFPMDDLVIAADIDRYDFAMSVDHESDYHILRPVK